MAIQSCSADQPCDVERTDQEALTELRQRFGEYGDVFSAGELARLGFVRWLFITGRFGPQGPTTPLADVLSE